MKKIDLEFVFRGADYHSIVRVGEGKNGKEYRITVLDWALERLLYGNHIIREADGVLQADTVIQRPDQTELKLVIASGLSRYLKIPCFAGEQCIVMSDVDDSGWEHLHPIARHGETGHFLRD